MDDELKTRFEIIDQRSEFSDKRIDDLKGYMGYAAAFLGLLFTAWFTVLTYVLSSNINTEKAELLDFQKNLREDLGKSQALPVLQLLGVNGEPLDGQKVIARFQKSEKFGLQIAIDHSIKNTGTVSTDPIYIKIYSKKPLQLENASTDEKQYDYEAVINPSQLDPNQLPGGLSTAYSYWVDLISEVIPPPGEYPALVKIYSGKGQVAKAQITILVSAPPPPPPPPVTK
jgi:hypothetical protein